MPNKIKYNLKNVHVAKLTRTVSEGGAVTYTYAEPVHIPGAVSLTMDAEGDNTPFYADGIVYYRSNVNSGYSGSLEMALIPDWFRKDILGEEEDTNKVLIEKTSGQPSPFALLFEFDDDAKKIRHAFYNCTASRPSVSSQTKESSISPVTETLELAADPRDDELVKARTGDETTAAAYNGWYSQVYTPAAA